MFLSFVYPSVRQSMMLFPHCLHYSSMDFHQTFVIGAAWDEDKVIRFWHQKVKGQGPSKGLSGQRRTELDALHQVLSLVWVIFP